MRLGGKSRSLAVTSLTIGRQAVALQELYLELFTLYIERSLLLLNLSIEKLLGCMEGWKGAVLEQMSPELENKAFSAKSTRYTRLKRHKESYNTVLETHK